LRVHISLTIAFILRPLRAKYIKQTSIITASVDDTQFISNLSQDACLTSENSHGCSLGSIERQRRSHGVHRVRQQLYVCPYFQKDQKDQTKKKSADFF
jgi:hypothetical protein